MTYYFSATLPVGFDEAVRRTMEVLKLADSVRDKLKRVTAAVQG